MRALTSSLIARLENAGPSGCTLGNANGIHGPISPRSHAIGRKAFEERHGIDIKAAIKQYQEEYTFQLAID